MLDFYHFFHHTSDNVKFKNPSADSRSSQIKSFNEMKNLAFDAQKATLELELKANPLSKDQLETIAKTAMKNHQPETYKMLASKYPNIITPTFTDNALNEVKPGNRFLFPFQASGCPATIFNENDQEGIKNFQRHCQPSSHYVISKGEWFDSSDFRTCEENRRSLWRAFI